MRSLVIVLSSIIMVLSLANCSRDKSDKRPNVDPNARRLKGGAGGGGGGSCRGCPGQPGGDRQEPGAITQGTGTPEPISGPSATGDAGRTSGGTGDDEGHADSTNADNTSANPRIETATKACRLEIFDEASLSAEQKALRFCDSVSVVTNANGDIDFDSIQIESENTKDKEFSGELLDVTENNGVISGTYTSAQTSSADGKQKLVTSIALPDSKDIEVTPESIAALQLTVKVGTQELTYALGDDGMELPTSDYQVRKDAKSGLVFIRITDVLGYISNITYVVEVTYKKPAAQTE